jgi:hypothetical protein
VKKFILKNINTNIVFKSVATGLNELISIDLNTFNIIIKNKEDNKSEKIIVTYIKNVFVKVLAISSS